MSRAAQIVVDYVQGREFAYPHSAEEYLAMAYDDMADRLRKAERERDEMRRQMNTTIEARALEITHYTRADIVPAPPTTKPGVWQLTIVPMMYEVHMISSHPSKWDARMVHSITEQAGRNFAGALMAKIRSLAA